MEPELEQLYNVRTSKNIDLFRHPIFIFQVKTERYFACLKIITFLMQDVELPDVPEPDQKAGILPTEIRKLVESRKEVKKLMKQPDLSPEIKQQVS